MTRLIHLRSLLPIVLLALLLTGAADETGSSTGTALQKVMRLYHLRIDSLGLALEELERRVARLDTTEGSSLTVRSAYREARRCYKRIEFLVEATERYSAWKLNGVPLPKINTTTRVREIIPPEGFQVIEEMIFDEAIVDHRDELLAQLRSMRFTQRLLRRMAEQITPTDRQVLEAMREQIIRGMALGIVGFDTPASDAAITETAASLAAVRDALAFYLPALAERNESLCRELVRLFDDAIACLRDNSDFDTFDRLHFIREFGNPLYARLLHAHRALGIETAAESVRFNLAVNYDAENIFAADFLNPWFYASGRREQHNEARAELGRILFFDPVLSGNDQRSCASCHRPEQAFTDGLPRSIAFHGNGSVERNAPTLLNAVFQSGQFHDMRASFFEDQIEQVLLNGNEMRMNFEELVGKLSGSPDYIGSFGRAFAGTLDTGISPANIRNAIAGYLRTLVALNSPFDRYMRGETTAIELAVRRGFNLFMGKAGCGTCHFAPVFNGTVPPFFAETEVEVPGTTANSNFDHPTVSADQGRYNVEMDEIHRRAFKTPTIRNVALTAPFMHNGAFASLEDVVEFYDRGGGAGLGLDIPNQTLPAEPLELSEGEKRDLVAFMQALTDTSGTTQRPASLPVFPGHPELNGRPVAGTY